MPDLGTCRQSCESGQPRATTEMLPLLYAELRRLADAKIRKEPPGQTLQATALVHEAYLRIVDAERDLQWDSKGHFFAAAAEAMRRVLVDNARRKASRKGGGGQCRVDLDDADVVTLPVREELLDLDHALTKLGSSDRELARLVTLRIFGGMTFEEVAAHLGTSVRTAKRNWAYARAWLGREMGAAGV